VNCNPYSNPNPSQPISLTMATVLPPLAQAPRGVLRAVTCHNRSACARGGGLYPTLEEPNNGDQSPEEALDVSLRDIMDFEDGKGYP